MQKLIGLSAALALPFALAACPSDDTGDDAANTSADTGMTSEPTAGSAEDTATGDVPAGCVGADGPRMEVAASIDGDTTLTCDTVWVLGGITIVSSGTLTIEPGTIIAGGAGSALVIDKSARIDAEGTEDAPIVMTSVTALDGNGARGDWGGLALLGEATVNLDGGTGVAEGFASDPPTYGGTNDAHDCGVLSYLRVEWAGNEVSPGNELNGAAPQPCARRSWPTAHRLCNTWRSIPRCATGPTPGTRTTSRTCRVPPWQAGRWSRCPLTAADWGPCWTWCARPFPSSRCSEA